MEIHGAALVEPPARSRQPRHIVAAQGQEAEPRQGAELVGQPEASVLGAIIIFDGEMLETDELADVLVEGPDPTRLDSSQ